MRWATTLILNGYEDMVRWISNETGYDGADRVLTVLEALDREDGAGAEGV